MLHTTCSFYVQEYSWFHLGKQILNRKFQTLNLNLTYYLSLVSCQHKLDLLISNCEMIISAFHLLVNNINWQLVVGSFSTQITLWLYLRQFKIQFIYLVSSLNLTVWWYWDNEHNFFQPRYLYYSSLISLTQLWQVLLVLLVVFRMFDGGTNYIIGVF